MILNKFTQSASTRVSIDCKTHTPCPKISDTPTDKLI